MVPRPERCQRRCFAVLGIAQARQGTDDERLGAGVAADRGIDQRFDQRLQLASSLLGILPGQGRRKFGQQCVGKTRLPLRPAGGVAAAPGPKARVSWWLLVPNHAVPLA